MIHEHRGALPLDAIREAREVARHHDFEEAWLHSPGGTRLVEAVRAAFARSGHAIAQLAPTRYEKLAGYDDDSAGANLRAWHTLPWPRRHTLEEETGLLFFEALLFLDHVEGPLDGPLEVQPGGRILGRAGDLVLVEGRLLRRRVDGLPDTPELWKRAVRKAKLPPAWAQPPARFDTSRLASLTGVTRTPRGPG